MRHAPIRTWLHTDLPGRRRLPPGKVFRVSCLNSELWRIEMSQCCCTWRWALCWQKLCAGSSPHITGTSPGGLRNQRMASYRAFRPESSPNQILQLYIDWVKCRYYHSHTEKMMSQLLAFPAFLGACPHYGGETVGIGTVWRLDVHGRGCNPHRCTTTFANEEITSLWRHWWRHNSETIRDRQKRRQPRAMKSSELSNGEHRIALRQLLQNRKLRHLWRHIFGFKMEIPKNGWREF